MMPEPVLCTPSAASELMCMLLALNSWEQGAQALPWAQSLRNRRPDLVAQVHALWPDATGYAHAGVELFIMAAAGGYVADPMPDRLLADLPSLVDTLLARAPGARPLHPDVIDIQGLVRPRLEALRHPDKMAAYTHLLSELWAEQRAAWDAKGLPALQSEAAQFGRRLNATGNIADALPPKHFMQLDRYAPILRSYMERARVLVTPLFFGTGGYFYDVDGTLHVGYALDPAQFQAWQRDRAAEIAPRLKAFSDPTRLGILAIIGEADVTVSDLAKLLGVAQPVVTKHLKLLEAAGLTSVQRIGTKAFYRASASAITELVAQAKGFLVRD